MAAPEDAADKPEETMRVIVAGQPDLDFCDNTISTSKYTLISFLPTVRTFLLWLLVLDQRRVFRPHGKQKMVPPGQQRRSWAVDVEEDTESNN
jgi:hypothetical protein